MTWFAAHVIMYIAFKDGKQDSYPVWENVILIEAESEDSARTRAAAYGREGEGDCDGTLRWAGRPASWLCAGVRKVVKCDSNPDAPGDGTEVTYSEIVLHTKDALSDLVAGRRVSLAQYD